MTDIQRATCESFQVFPHRPRSFPSPARRRPPSPSRLFGMARSQDNVDYSLLKDDNIDAMASSGSDLLLGSFDPSKLHPLAGIEDKLDYLQLDDDKTSDLPGAEGAIPSRGWSDDLCYGTGTTYLSGSYSLSAFHAPPPLPSSFFFEL